VTGSPRRRTQSKAGEVTANRGEFFFSMSYRIGQSTGELVMADQTAKSSSSKPSKEAMRLVPSPSLGSTMQLNATSKPRSLPKRPRTPMIAVARWVMIAEAAYYIAEHRGFAQGHELEDWLLAEKQIDAMLSCEAPRARAAASEASPLRWCDL